MKRICMLILACAALSFAANVTVTDDDIQTGDNVTWTSNNTYILDGFVFVDSGASLTIKPGTVIKGKPGTGANASALIVARHGKIFALGTKTKPIIFTAVSDNGNLPLTARGLWGGLIVLGNAQINTTAGEGQIEGIPSTESRGKYGGDDDADNSGVIRFVSIRYGGSEIGAGNEINGLTLGAVGSGTIIEFVEVLNNKDDGFEWFGGTAQCRYLVAAFCGDDAFDYDEGWRGRGQYWFAIMRDDGNGEGDKGGEHDGGTDPEDGTPYAKPVISNVTYIGPGNDVGGGVFNIRDNAGGKYFNSLFYDFKSGAKVEDLEEGEDSRARLEAGELELSHNLWYSVSSANNLDSVASNQGYLKTHLADTDNEIADPALASISRSASGELDPRPEEGSPLLDASKAFAKVDSVDGGGFIQATSYRGAFNQYDLWIRDWTGLDELGFMPERGGVVEITDESIIKGQHVRWTSDNTYLLKGFVFVDSGAVLTIDPGTIIKGAPGQGANASALIVARHGKIMAMGTKNEPIVFTAEADNGDLPASARGLWGGIILLGNAQINTTAGVGQIEGIPSTEPRGAYGGDDDEDNSGVLRFVSIRHGGTEIGAGNEINGLTMGAVGSKTTIEFIEVYNNKDDGFEWFGGTARCRYLVSSFNGDDAFDYDEGFRGRGQYWFAIMRDDGNGEGDKAGEHDGGTDPEDGEPYAMPVISNVTYVGPGKTVGGGVFNIRDNAGGKYFNSIFYDFKSGAKVEDLDEGEDSRKRMDQGELLLAGNIWHQIGDNTIETVSSEQSYLKAHLEGNTNTISNPLLTAIARSASDSLDPRPKSGSPALEAENLFAQADSVDGSGFIAATDYAGAFSQFDLWIRDWTALAEKGYVAPRGGVVEVTDDDITAGQVVNWTSDNVYLLKGFVFVDSGAVLNIGPGTTIKGAPGQGANASALIVARNGKIMAEGTADNPIVFTSEADDGNLPLTARGLWGGVILLGNATINTTAGVGQIEGIPSTEPRGAYGGDDDADNSGVVSYVSIRYGGTEIGAGNEINGLTMGAVGRGTRIENVEVYNNKDDGFEWFGGTVNCKRLISAFNGDDAFDYDEGWRGNGQFWFSIMRDDGNGEGDKAGEHDGGTDPEDGEPYSMPVIYNATYIGPGQDVGGGVLNIRDNAGGKYINSIFYDFKSGAKVEDLGEGEDSRERMKDGELMLAGNIWYNIGDNELASVSSEQAYLETHLDSFENAIADPLFAMISRDSDEKLNPLPDTTGPAFEDLVDLPAGDAFFAPVDFKGAFGRGNWAKGWSMLSTGGFFNPDIVNILAGQGGRILGPNALQATFANNRMQINYTLSNAQDISMGIFDLAGRTVAQLQNGMIPAGSHRLSWNASGMGHGYYVLRMTTAKGAMTVPFVIAR